MLNSLYFCCDLTPECKSSRDQRHQLKDIINEQQFPPGNAVFHIEILSDPEKTLDVSIQICQLAIS